MEMTFNEAYEKLDSILESALLDYEIAVLTEAEEAPAAEGEAAPVESQEKKASGKVMTNVKLILGKIWEAIIKACQWIRNTAVKLAAGKGGAVTAGAGTCCLGAVDFARTQMYVREAWKAINKDGEQLPNSEELLTPIKRDTAVSYQNIAKTFTFLEDMAKQFANFSKNKANKGDAGTKARAAANVFKQITADVKKLLDSANTGKADGSGQETVGAKKAALTGNLKAADAAKRITGKTTLPLGEGATAVERMALLLVEAANMLMNEECDGAGCHVDGVEGGEGTQDPVDEIAEEKPVEDQEYDADVNGGEGEKPDLEEIKELCGDDKEALALLTDDEGGACCESVVITF